MPIIRSPGCCTFVLKMNILETVLGLFEVTVTAAYPDEPPVIKFQRCNWSEGKGSIKGNGKNASIKIFNEFFR